MTEQRQPAAQRQVWSSNPLRQGWTSHASPADVSLLSPAGSTAGAEGAFAHHFGRVRVQSSIAPRLQAKLLLGRPGDRHEQEADAVAEAVMAGPRAGLAPLIWTPSPQPGSLDTIRRQATGEEEPYREPPEPIGLSAAVVEDEDEQRLQAKAAPGASPLIGAGVEQAISASRGSGQALPASARHLMESRFGADFSSVRIHASSDAAQLAASVRARAFTVGQDIYFGSGEYAPHSPAGQRLLAHELTHVVQQGGGRSRHPMRADLQLAALESPLMIQRTLSQAYSNYRGSCDCGEDLGNNCAHYLSDSLIRSGYAGDLDGGTGALYRRRNGRIVCKAGRPVRARELAAWFAGQATDTHEGEPDNNAYWAVYQERASDGQGHVVIHSHSGTAYTWRGTGDYPTWRTQDHHTF